MTMLGSFYPSIGGCDEMLHVAYIIFQKTSTEIKEMQGTMHGEIDTNESIKLTIVPFTMNNILATKDSKALACSMFILQKFNLLPIGQLRVTGKK